MRIYKAYLHQEGGCDYTIGCGNLLIDIEAESMKEAYMKLSDYIEENYTNDESRLDSVEFFEVTQSASIEMKSFYKSIDHENQKKRDLRKELEEREFYEKLKLKYDN